MEKLIKIGRELGIKDDHKYVMVRCPECHNERWVRIDKQPMKCYRCSRPTSLLGALTDERRSKLSTAIKRRIELFGLPKEFYRNLSGSNNPMFGKQQTIASIEKNRQSNKRNWESPEYQDKWAKANLYPHVKQNKPEHEIEDYLKYSGVEFVGDGRFWIGYPPRNPDFIHRKNRKIVEFFGNYWHKPKDELDRVNHYKKYGWDCLVIWESIYNNDKELMIARIKEFVQ